MNKGEMVKSCHAKFPVSCSIVGVAGQLAYECCALRGAQLNNNNSH